MLYPSISKGDEAVRPVEIDNRKDLRQMILGVSIINLGNRERCYPLTVTDNFSRYLLAVEGLSSIYLRAFLLPMSQSYKI